MSKGPNRLAYQTAWESEAPELAPGLATGDEPPPLAASLRLEGRTSLPVVESERT